MQTNAGRRHRRQIEETAMLWLMRLCLIGAALVLGLILLVIFWRGMGALSWEMLTQPPAAAYDLGGQGGIANAIVGSLLLAAGATCLALLQHLKQKKDLTIITNSIRLVNDFVNSPFRMISSGGILRAHSYALTGSVACATLKKYYVDLAIISCKGIDREKGLMESNEEESEIKQIMIEQAKKAILLADHSKFGKTAFIKTCDFSKIAAIVTDADPGDAWKEFLAKQQIKLIS